MRRWFYLVVALQILFLVAEVGTNEMRLSRGRTVILRVAPVDPRSLFMGHYIWLSYDITSLDLRKVRCSSSIETSRPGATVYVGLLPEKPWAKPVSVETSLDAGRDPAPVYLRGTVSYSHDSSISVDYGLERYYIPEAKREKANRMMWGLKGRPIITVEVVVDESGGSLIRRVLVNGKPLGF